MRVLQNAGRPRREEGFSLVELVVAIALFALVMAPLAGTFIAAARSVGEQGLRTEATRVASDRLETLRALPFDQLEEEAGETTVTTPRGRAFTVVTDVIPIDAVTGEPAAGGDLKRVTVAVSWTFGGETRVVSTATAMAPDDPGAVTPPPSIVAVNMFPSPATTDATGQPLQDIEATVTLAGFAASTLVHLAWSNADGTAGAEVLTTAGGASWRGTVSRDRVRGVLSSDGTGEVQFTVAAGALTTVSTLSLQKAVTNPPVITVATIDRAPITVDTPGRGRTCSDRNECRNTTDVTFTVTGTGLALAQDSLIVHYQLADGTFQELPLTPAEGQWRATVRQRTTKFRPGTARAFRFSALRLADGATATTTIERDVVSV